MKNSEDIIEEDNIQFSDDDNISSESDIINLFALVPITATLAFSSFNFEQNAEKLII